ncbi:uncharacterized protein [Ptychodera flava]|uniref:uncharacterized protein n=1 Tax=Ptychodera flava TaxID=63121 RepID=UPI003969F959
MPLSTNGRPFIHRKRKLIEHRQADDKATAHCFDMAADQENAPSTCGGGTKKSIRERVLCAVCSDTASGRYYGAIICEACKIFFIRSTRKGEPEFVCANGQRCEITPTTRLLCQSCRFRKCIAVGMCRKEKTPRRPTPDQILCRVCCDVSSGIHFGVYTCEGCKGFFRRSSNSGDHVNYKCQGNRDCEITPTTRNLCRYCRYNKCLNEGMSRDSKTSNSMKIQLGRHHKDGKDEKNDIAGYHTGVSTLSSSAESDSSKMTNLRTGGVSVKTEQSPTNRYQYPTAQYWVGQKEGSAEISSVSANFQELDIKQDSSLSPPQEPNGYPDSHHDVGSGVGYSDGGKYYPGEPGEHLISQQPDHQDDMNQYYEQMQNLPPEMEVSGFTGGSNLVAIQKIIDSEDYPTDLNVTSQPFTSGSTTNKPPCALDLPGSPSSMNQENYYSVHTGSKTKVQKNETKYPTTSVTDQLPNQYNTAYLVNLEKDYPRDQETKYQLSPTCMMPSQQQQHSTSELYHNSSANSNAQGYSVLKEELFPGQRSECQLPGNPAKSPRPNVIKYANEHHQLKVEPSGYQMPEVSRQDPYLPPGSSCCTVPAHARPKSQEQYYQPTSMAAPVTSHVTPHKAPEPYYHTAYESIPEISLGEDLHQHVPEVSKHEGVDCWPYCPTHTTHGETSTVSVTYPTFTTRPITISNNLLDCKNSIVANPRPCQNVKPVHHVFPELEPYAKDVKGINNVGMSISKHPQERIKKDAMCPNRHSNYMESQGNSNQAPRNVQDESGLEGFQEFWERVAKDLLDEPQKSCENGSNSKVQPSSHISSPIPVNGNFDEVRLPKQDAMLAGKCSESSHKHFSKKQLENTGSGKAFPPFSVPIITYPNVTSKSMKREHPDDNARATQPGKTLNVSPTEMRRHIKDALNCMHQAMNAYSNSEEHCKASEELSRSGQPVGPAWEKVKERVICQDSSVVKFIKKVPGFRDLIMGDQIMLVKYSAFAGQAPYLSHHNDVYAWFVKTVLEMKGLKAVVDYFKEILHSFIMDFQKLSLNQEQLGLYTALVVANPNAPHLVDRESVAKLNQVISEALKSSIKESGRSMELYNTLVDFMPELVRMNKVLKNGFRTGQPSVNFDLPALSAELYY